MSQLIIRKNNRSKSINDDDDNQSYDHSINNKVKYLTPRKYRPIQRTPLANIHDEIPLNKDEYSLTPSKYRLRKAHEDNTKLLYNKYPVIIGDFTLTKKPEEDNSIYTYKPKHTQISYIYHGTANSTEVQERAMNEIKQYAQSSSPMQKKIPFMNDRNHYQSMLSLPTNHSRSASNDDLIINHTRDPIHESLRRRNHPLTSLYPSNLPHIPIRQNDRYYFGEQFVYSSPDEDEEEESPSEDELCLTFGRESHPKAILKYSSFIPPISKKSQEKYLDLIFQEVADIGTSTDDFRSDTTTDDRRDTSSNQLQSLVTNQSSRSETEIYRVSHQILDRDNYEEPDTVPFPTVKHPPSISTSSSPTIFSDKNQYEMNSIDDVDQTLTKPIDKQNNYYIEDDDEETLRSMTPEPSIKLQRLPRQNLVIDLPTSNYENPPIIREPESDVSHKSVKSDKSRRSFFNLFNRQKKKDEKSTNKKKEKKKGKKT